MAKGFAPTSKSEIHPGSTPPQPLQTLEAIQDNLLSSLEEIKDPRSTRNQKHLLKDILVIAILAAIATPKAALDFFLRKNIVVRAIANWLFERNEFYNLTEECFSLFTVHCSL